MEHNAFMKQPIVQSRLASAAGLPADPGQGGTHIVYGLALVKESAVDYPISDLTVLTAEQKASDLAFRGIGGGGTYFWEIVEFIPTPALPIVDSDCRRSTVFLIAEHEAQSLQDSLGDGVFARLLQRHGVAPTSSVMSLPICLMTLVCARLWVSLPLSGKANIRRKSEFFGWKRRAPRCVVAPAQAVVEEAPAAPIDDGVEDVPHHFLSDNLESVIDTVRVWRGMLLNGDPLDKDEEESNVQLVISSLLRLNRELGHDALRDEAVSKSGYYRMEHLIKVVGHRESNTHTNSKHSHEVRSMIHSSTGRPGEQQQHHHHH